MRRRHCIAALVLMSLPALGMAASTARCKLGAMAELPVTMSNSKPIVTAQINGKDARFVADSGAFFSMITAASAAQFNLKLSPAPWGLYVRGVGGSVDLSIATVKQFTLVGIPVKNVQFLVGGSSVGGSDVVGLLGQNLFRIGDVEYDLAKGAIRLMYAEGCKNALLAYWTKPTDFYSVIDIEWPTAASPHTTGTASINGQEIRVMFDTGAGTSMLSMRAAERAGIKPDSNGVIEAGYEGGIGPSRVKTYIGTFASFKIGDEEIHNARLRFGDIGINSDMLIGADFFLSHRIYVASSQHKLYFTYNGGPVFNLTAGRIAAEAAPVAGSDAAAEEAGDKLADAGAYSRRGAAFAGRHDYEHALADLTRACEMEPTQPEYFYQRGVVYQDNGQTDRAAADFDRAIEIKSDDLHALEARARLRLSAADVAGAGEDLDTLDRVALKEADLRLFLAYEYLKLDRLWEAITEFDLWIPVHDQDSRAPAALNGRCRAKVLQGRDLNGALSDCDAALWRIAKSSPLSAGILSNRGLIRLRQGEYGKSHSDYDGSLKINPQNAWSLYGRGIDELHERKPAQADADMKAAEELRPKIPEEFARLGIAP